MECKKHIINTYVLYVCIQRLGEIREGTCNLFSVFEIMRSYHWSLYFRIRMVVSLITIPFLIF